MKEPKTSVRAIVFDAYGTLFDVHSVTTEAETLFPGKGSSLSRVWRTKQLEYTWLRSLMGRYVNFEDITSAALDTACRTLGLPLNQAGAKRLMNAYRTLQTFPEVLAALQHLQQRSYPLAILSNGSPDMLNAAVHHAGLDALLNTVLSVDSLKIFKPAPSVYALAADRLGVPAGEVGFVSSNFWDIAGATSFGFHTFWINRSGNVSDNLGFQPVATLTGLEQLSALLN